MTRARYEHQGRIRTHRWPHDEDRVALKTPHAVLCWEDKAETSFTRETAHRKVAARCTQYDATQVLM